MSLSFEIEYKTLTVLVVDRVGIVYQIRTRIRNRLLYLDSDICYRSRNQYWLSPTLKTEKAATTKPCVAILTLWSLQGGAVAQSVERPTPGEDVPGSIAAVAARSLLVGSVSV